MFRILKRRTQGVLQLSRLDFLLFSSVKILELKDEDDSLKSGI